MHFSVRRLQSAHFLFERKREMREAVESTASTSGVPSAPSPKGSCVQNQCRENNGDAFIRVDANGDECASGEYLFFGNYPQSKVTGDEANGLTNLVGEMLPTAAAPLGWTSYRYCIKSKLRDYMWYKDVVCNGERYRGVYFTLYRPYWTDYGSSKSNTYQKDNGFIRGKVHWFKYEPIKWKILKEKKGEALILSDMLIDSQAYQTMCKYINRNCYAADGRGNIIKDKDGNNVYANNYGHSSVRGWLNGEFYNTAFDEFEKDLILLSAVENSAASTGYEMNKYTCDSTKDYVFLPSKKEILTEDYGFSADCCDYDTARRKQITAYAQCQGAYTYSIGDYSGNAMWCLRSPYDDFSYGGYDNRAFVVEGVGCVSSINVDSTGGGICPALRIRI